MDRSERLQEMIEKLNDRRDPWRGRQEGMNCKSCVWFVIKSEKIGRCRKHAPTMTGYPVVFENDWCGDHKLDENKYISE